MTHRPTISETIARLHSLAADLRADWTHVIYSDYSGVRLTVLWDNSEGTGLGSIADMPRDATLYFSTDKTAEGRFQWAWVSDPGHYVWACEEGLTEEQAQDEARRTVLELDEVLAYLAARPYKAVETSGRRSS